MTAPGTMPEFEPPSTSRPGTPVAHAARGLRVLRVVARLRSRTRRLFRRRWVAFVAGALAMGAVVGAGVALVDAQRPSLEAVAAAYLEAAAARDVGAMLALSRPDASVASTALLTTPVYASADGAAVRCDDPRVGDGDEAATATMACTDAFESPLEVSFVRESDGWRVEHGLEQVVHVLPGGARVAAIGGVAVPEEVQDGEMPLWLFPGSYLVEAASLERGDLEQLGFAWVSGEATSISAAVVPAPALLDAAEDAAAALVERCLAEPAEDCPDLAPATDATAWDVVAQGPTTPIAGAADAGSISILVLAQRIDDGVPGEVHRIVLTAALDGEEGSLEVEEDPEHFVP